MPSLNYWNNFFRFYGRWLCNRTISVLAVVLFLSCTLMQIIPTMMTYESISWTCENCFKRNYSFTIEPVGICNTYHDHIPGPHIIVVVKSGLENKDRRNCLRKTILSQTERNTNMYLRHVFIVGQTKNMSLQEQIHREAMEHEDMIQEDILDTYGKLTYKTLAALDWAITRCNQANYILSLDDDSYVNLTKLIHIDENINPKYRSQIANSLVGACLNR